MAHIAATSPNSGGGRPGRVAPKQQVLYTAYQQYSSTVRQQYSSTSHYTRRAVVGGFFLLRHIVSGKVVRSASMLC